MSRMTNLKGSARAAAARALTHATRRLCGKMPGEDRRGCSEWRTYLPRPLKGRYLAGGGDRRPQGGLRGQDGETFEAARSDRFGAERPAALLVLARDMRAHDRFLREATSLESHMDRAWARRSHRQAESGHEEFFRLYRRYAQAARMLQLSGESIVAG